MEEGWRRVHSPSSRLAFLLAGLIGLAFPNLLLAWLIAVSLLAAPNGGANAGGDASTPWGMVILALLLFIPLHELVHAIWHPRMGLSPQTVMVIWPTKLRFGVYYEGCMGRGHWLTMRMAPLVCLSILPVGLLTLFMFIPAPFALEVFLQVLLLANGIGSGGDLLAVVWVLFQVPAKAQICFRGGKAYWRLAPETHNVALP